MYGSFFYARNKMLNLISRSGLVLFIGLALVLSGCSNEDPLTEELLVADFAVAYIKRPSRSLVNPAAVTIAPEELDINEDEGLLAGDVYIRDLSSPSAEERNITGALTAAIATGNNMMDKSAGDVAGLEVSYDGTRLLFAVHEGVYVDEMTNGINTWNIWEYDIPTDTLRRIIASDGFANEGDDYDPHYLPDGRIVFTSNRQAGHTVSNRNIGTGPQEKTFDEARQQFSYVLHVMDADGENRRQISYNMSSDLGPTLLPDGRILFTRWDRLGNNKFSLYTVYSDGTEMNPLYGVHSTSFTFNNGNNTQNVAYMDVRPTQKGKLVATYVPREGAQGTGEMVLIDYQNFTDLNVKKFGSSSSSTTGHVSATNNEVRLTAGISQYGRYVTPYPIWEPNGGDRMLVSWTVCRLKPVGELDDTPEEDRIRVPCVDSNLADPDFEVAPPFFGVYMYDLNSGKKRPIVLPESEDFSIVNPVAILNRPLEDRPVEYIDKTTDNGLLDTDMAFRLVGAINIKTVYDTQGPTPMVDKPLEPHNANVLTQAQRDSIPRTTLMIDTVTGAPDFDGTSPNPKVARNVADVTVLRDPLQTTADQRLARFVRIIKGVVVYDPQGDDRIENVYFGRTGGYRMREILGYKEIEPDGSIFMEVPANVPFAIQILDAQGRAFMAHDNWMQLVPGETRVCNGCHSPNDKQQSINPGAPLGLFPNTVNSIVPELGETMAETRNRMDRLIGGTYPFLSMDIIYDDVWSDPGISTPNASFSFSYADLDDYDTASELDDSIPKPIKNDLAACETEWSWQNAKCRIVIDYATHIQPIWDRALYVDDGVANGMDTEFRAACSSCHRDDTVDALMNPINKVPDGQLNLEAVADGNVAERLHSYEQLTATRDLLELDAMGNLVPQTTVDADGNIIILTTGREVTPGVAGTRSSALIDVLTNPGSPSNAVYNHVNTLLPGEWRLLIEWIDNGTQYFNDPVAAPKG